MLRTQPTPPSQPRENPVAGNKGVVDAYFSWLGRDGLDELVRAAKLLHAVPLVQEILDAMPIAVAVLNEKGQVVLMNRRWSESHGNGAGCALGKRPGELLNCVHSGEGPDGCGTSRYCERCGAAVSIMTSHESQGQATGQYHLILRTPEESAARDLVATSTAIRVEGRAFTVFAVQESGQTT